MSTVDVALEPRIEGHRRELTGYCYRMLGSGFEAEDAVQETMVRAWRSMDQLEGEAALRAWLYRIATNVCIDMMRSAQRRARPMDLSPASTAETLIAAPTPQHEWIQPILDDRVVPLDGDPADVAAARESIRLAFVAALQHLPARQRAVLILREVLRWKAAEVAELLDTSVASVNSALQRARATLADVDVEGGASDPIDEEQRVLLARYVDAFERYDVDAFVALLHEDAVQTMPPFALWLRGREELGKWWYGQGIACKGSRVLEAGMANGLPAFASYKPSPDGGYEPWSFHVVDVRGGRIAGIHHFIYPELFTAFGLPARLD